MIAGSGPIAKCITRNRSFKNEFYFWNSILNMGQILICSKEICCFLNITLDDKRCIFGFVSFATKYNRTVATNV